MTLNKGLISVKPRILLGTLILAGTLLLIMLKPALSSPLNQLNPTQQQQTINAIINPRLTLTAAAIKSGPTTPTPTTSGTLPRPTTIVNSPSVPTATPTQSL